MLLLKTGVPTCLWLSFILVVFVFSCIQSRQQQNAAFPFSQVLGALPAGRNPSWLRAGFLSSCKETRWLKLPPWQENEPKQGFWSTGLRQEESESAWVGSVTLREGLAALLAWPKPSSKAAPQEQVPPQRKQSWAAEWCLRAQEEGKELP